MGLIDIRIEHVVWLGQRVWWTGFIKDVLDRILIGCYLSLKEVCCWGRIKVHFIECRICIGVGEAGGGMYGRFSGCSLVAGVLGVRAEKRRWVCGVE